LINIDFSYSKILKTTNGGQNLILQYYDSNNTIETYNIFAVNANKLWCGTMTNRVFTSTNRGSTWGKQTSQIIVDNFVHMVDTLLGFAWCGSINSNNFTRTTNGGGPITKITISNEKIPNQYILKQNYPNPFNSETEIEFSIPKSSIVSINIYDVLGREVIKAIDSKEFSEGSYGYKIDFGNYNLSSGIYFYRFTAFEKSGGNIFSDTKKLIFKK
jgi:hypothetical protein